MTMMTMMKPLVAIALLLLAVSGQQQRQQQQFEQETVDRGLHCDNETDGSGTGSEPSPLSVENDMVPTFSGSTAMPTPTAFAAINQGDPYAAPSSSSTSSESPATSAPTVFVVGDRGFLPTAPPTSSPVTVIANSPTTGSPISNAGAPVSLPVAAPTRPPTAAPVTSSPTTRKPTPSPVPRQTPAPVRPPTRIPTRAPVTPPSPAPLPAVVTTSAPVSVLILPPNDDVAPAPAVDDCFDCFDFINPVSGPGRAAAQPENISAASQGLGAVPLIGVALGGMLIVAGVVLAGRNRWASKERLRRMAVAGNLTAAGDSMDDAEDSLEPNSPMSAKDSLAIDRFSAAGGAQDGSAQIM